MERTKKREDASKVADFNGIIKIFNNFWLVS
jgi:hypothetical protein